MKEFMKKVKWDSVIIAILTIVTGILCVVMPNQVADVLCIVYGYSLFYYNFTICFCTEKTL